jgi:two-component system phosphate regulon sensor histidine kinase PhoR
LKHNQPRGGTARNDLKPHRRSGMKHEPRTEGASKLNKKRGQRIAIGILTFPVGLTFFWTIGYLVVFYMSDIRSKPLIWDELLEYGKSVSAASDSIDQMEDRLEVLSQTTGTTIVLTDWSGKKRGFGIGADILAEQLDERAVRDVLDGAMIKDFERERLWTSGTAMTGQAVPVAGEQAALFIKKSTQAPFQEYGKHVLALQVGLLIILICILAATPWRKDFHWFQMMLDAMRRMAKGDFDVRLQVHKRFNGELGELMDGLNQMAVGLTQMEQMRQEFISNVSHEIQSPLTSITGFAKALQNEELSMEQRRHYLSIIETESMRISKISDNLLKLTSLESQQHPFEPKRYRLDKQLRSIVLACEPQWVEKSIEMDVSLEETWVSADEDLMSQVWVNLLHNAIKFTPNGGTISVQVTSGAEEQQSAPEVHISDTGIGISEEEQAHIFDRFYKADVSRSRAGGGGSGLGLSIVKKIIEMHQGVIRVQSSPSEGATFIVTLPLYS